MPPPGDPTTPTPSPAPAPKPSPDLAAAKARARLALAKAKARAALQKAAATRQPAAPVQPVAPTAPADPLAGANLIPEGWGADPTSQIFAGSGGGPDRMYAAMLRGAEISAREKAKQDQRQKLHDSLGAALALPVSGDPSEVEQRKQAVQMMDGLRSGDPDAVLKAEKWANAPAESALAALRPAPAENPLRMAARSFTDAAGGLLTHPVSTLTTAPIALGEALGEKIYGDNVADSDFSALQVLGARTQGQAVEEANALTGYDPTKNDTMVRNATKGAAGSLPFMATGMPLTRLASGPLAARALAGAMPGSSDAMRQGMGADVASGQYTPGEVGLRGALTGAINAGMEAVPMGGRFGSDVALATGKRNAGAAAEVGAQSVERGSALDLAAGAGADIGAQVGQEFATGVAEESADIATDKVDDDAQSIIKRVTESGLTEAMGGFMTAAPLSAANFAQDMRKTGQENNARDVRNAAAAHHFGKPESTQDLDAPETVNPPQDNRSTEKADAPVQPHTPTPAPAEAPARGKIEASPVDLASAQKYGAEYVKEVAPGRTGPPIVSAIGFMHEGLPGDQKGRLVGYEAAATTDRPHALRYIFEMENGERVGFKGSEVQGAMPIDGSAKPVAVKRKGANAANQAVAPAGAPEVATKAEQPAKAAPSPATKDAPTPGAPEGVAGAGRGGDGRGRRLEAPVGERQEGGQVREVEAFARRGAALAADPAIRDLKRAMNRAEAAFERDPSPENKVTYEALRDRHDAAVDKANPPAQAESVPEPEGSSDAKPVNSPSAATTAKPEASPVVPRTVPDPEPEVEIDSPPPREGAVTAEHRVREFGPTSEEANALEGDRDSALPDIPDVPLEASEFLTGRKRFESEEQFKRWYRNLPAPVKSAIKEHGSTDITTDAEGHVMAAQKVKVNRPSTMRVPVIASGVAKNVEMEVRALHEAENIDDTAGSDATGNTETLPRYYVGKVTDPSAPPGMRNKWMVLQWDKRGDRHVREKGGQRRRFVDVPHVAPVTGEKNSVFNTYSDAKRAAIEVVGKTKRVRDADDAKRYGKAEKPELGGRKELSLKDPVAPSEVEGGKVSFRSADDFGEKAINRTSPKQAGEYAYDRSVDEWIAAAEKAGPRDIEKLEELATKAEEIAKEVPALRNVQVKPREPRLGTRAGAVPSLDAIIDSIAKLISQLRPAVSRATGALKTKLSDLVSRLAAALRKIRAPQPANVAAQAAAAARGQVQRVTLKNLMDRIHDIRKAGHLNRPVGQAIKKLYRNAVVALKILSPYRHLNMKKAAHAELANLMRVVQGGDTSARGVAALIIHGYSQPLKNANDYHLFSNKLVLDDLVREMERGAYGETDVIPFTDGLKGPRGEQVIRDAHAAITAEVNRNPTVKKAVEERAQAWRDEVTGPLAALGEFDASLLDQPYFRHQILQYYGANSKLAEGLTADIRALGAGSSVMARRNGSPQEYNTSFEEADLEALTKLVALLHKSVLHRHIEATSYNKSIRRSIQDENAHRFEELVNNGDPAVQTGMQVLTDLQTAGVPLPPAYATLTGGPLMQQIIRSNDWVASRIKAAALGNRYRAPNDYVGAQHDDMTPGLVPEGVVAIQFDHSMNLAPVETKDGDVVMAMMGKKPPIMVDEAVARQLNETLKQDPGENLWQTAVRKVSRFVLRNPITIAPYLFTNAASNASIAQMQDPGVFAKMGRAGALIYKFHAGEKMSAAELTIMKDALKFGVVGSHEAAQFNEQALARFNQFQQMAGRPDAALQGSSMAGKMKWLWRSYGRLNSGAIALADDSFKLAAYLHLLEKRDGTMIANPHFASNRAEIEAARSTEEAAAIQARQMFGDYGALSVFGQTMRKNLLPFYSWAEVSVRLVAKSFRNAVTSKNVALVAPLLAVKVASLHVALAAFNAAAMDDEEEEDFKRAGFDPAGDLYVGRDADGRMRGLPLPFIFRDFVRWIGMEDMTKEFEEVAKGESSTRTVTDLVKDMPRAAAWRIADMATPLVQIPASLLYDRDVNGQSMRTRVVQEPIRDALASLGLRKLVQATGDAPKPKWSMADLMTFARDPDEQEYFRSKSMVYAYDKTANPAHASPAGGGGSIRSEVDNDIFNFRAAIRLEDKDAAREFIAKYYDKGTDDHPTNPETVRKGFAALRPDRGLSEKTGMYERFLESLTPVERKRFDRSLDYHDKLFNPQKNKLLATVLREAASGNPKFEHMETKLDVNAFLGDVQDKRGDDPGVSEVIKGVEDLYSAAKTFQAWERAAAKFEQAMKYVDPATAEDYRRQAAIMRQRGTEAAAPVRPVVDREP